MKYSFTVALLVIGLSSCVSSTDPQISNHESNHSFLSLERDCQSITLEQSRHEVSYNNGLDPTSISLLNWNVYKGSKNNWAADFHRLSQGKDIITLQEALLDDGLHKTLDMRNFYWGLTTAFIYKEANVGVLTAALVSPLDQCSVHSDEPFIQLPKTLMVSQYLLLGSNETLLVANIHSINFSLGIDKYTEQIQALENAIKQHSGPIIVAGDFNSWSDRRMGVIKQLQTNLSLSALPYQNHKRTRIFGNPIDHIFYRGLTPQDIATPEINSSDHNPISVTFSVKTPLDLMSSTHE